MPDQDGHNGSNSGRAMTGKGVRLQPGPRKERWGEGHCLYTRIRWRGVWSHAVGPVSEGLCVRSLPYNTSKFYLSW